MRAFLLISMMLASGALLGQAPAPTTACGPEKIRFKAQVADGQSIRPVPQPGKAMVFFIEDDGVQGDDQHFTLKIGVDGSWVGAYKGNSWIGVQVNPGEHHVCAAVQSDLLKINLIQLAHVTAEPGKMYYIRTRFLAGAPGGGGWKPYLNLDVPDSDEAEYLLTSYPMSIWKQR